MTEEQIKQIAEAWVKPLIGAENDGKYSENSVSIALMKNAFIEGAHSRNEEIKELKRKNIEYFQSMEYWQKRARRLNIRRTKQGEKTNELQNELDKLRNPWISVKEKRPPIKTRVLFLDYNGKAWFGKNTISDYAELESDKQEILPPPTVPTCKPIITHWMPIPEIPTKQ